VFSKFDARIVLQLDQCGASHYSCGAFCAKVPCKQSIVNEKERIVLLSSGWAKSGANTKGNKQSRFEE